MFRVTVVQVGVAIMLASSSLACSAENQAHTAPSNSASTKSCESLAPDEKLIGSGTTVAEIEKIGKLSAADGSLMSDILVGDESWKLFRSHLSATDIVYEYAGTNRGGIVAMRMGCQVFSTVSWVI